MPTVNNTQIKKLIDALYTKLEKVSNDVADIKKARAPATPFDDIKDCFTAIDRQLVSIFDNISQIDKKLISRIKGLESKISEVGKQSLKAAASAPPVHVPEAEPIDLSPVSNLHDIVNGLDKKLELALKLLRTPIKFPDFPEPPLPYPMDRIEEALASSQKTLNSIEGITASTSKAISSIKFPDFPKPPLPYPMDGIEEALASSQKTLNSIEKITASTSKAVSSIRIPEYKPPVIQTTEVDMEPVEKLRADIDVYMKRCDNALSHIHKTIDALKNKKQPEPIVNIEPPNLDALVESIRINREAILAVQRMVSNFALPDVKVSVDALDISAITSQLEEMSISLGTITYNVRALADKLYAPPTQVSDEPEFSESVSAPKSDVFLPDRVKAGETYEVEISTDYKFAVLIVFAMNGAERPKFGGTLEDGRIHMSVCLAPGALPYTTYEYGIFVGDTDDPSQLYAKSKFSFGV